MPEKYIILRKPKSAPAGGLESMSARRTEATVTSAALSRSESHDASRDPDNLIVAPAMPMKLIAPVEISGAAPAPAAVNWGIQAVKADVSPFTGQGITVACLDTGIDRDHPAFAGMDIVYKNFTEEEDVDYVGHGTHCAGTIAGQDVAGVRIGIARGVRRLLIAKVLGVGGSGSDTIAQAILWAVSEGAHVVSMSLGVDFPGQVARLTARGMAVNAATSRALEDYRRNINLFSQLANLIRQMSPKTIVVAASGNESKRRPAGSTPPGYEIAVAPPAAGTDIIAVGALAKTDEGLAVADFSNDQVDIAAPGVGIRSAEAGGGLKELSGTSMATPHVAGVAALWAQRQFEQTGRVDQSLLRAHLLASGTLAPLQAGWAVDDVGAGIVQAPL